MALGPSNHTSGHFWHLGSVSCNRRWLARCKGAQRALCWGLDALLGSIFLDIETAPLAWDQHSLMMFGI